MCWQCFMSYNVFSHTERKLFDHRIILNRSFQTRQYNSIFSHKMLFIFGFEHWQIYQKQTKKIDIWIFLNWNTRTLYYYSPTWKKICKTFSHPCLTTAVANSTSKWFFYTTFSKIPIILTNVLTIFWQFFLLTCPH